MPVDEAACSCLRGTPASVPCCPDSPSGSEPLGRGCPCTGIDTCYGASCCASLLGSLELLHCTHAGVFAVVVYVAMLILNLPEDRCNCGPVSGLAATAHLTPAGRALRGLPGAGQAAQRRGRLPQDRQQGRLPAAPAHARLPDFMQKKARAHAALLPSLSHVVGGAAAAARYARHDCCGWQKSPRKGMRRCTDMVHRVSLGKVVMGHGCLAAFNNRCAAETPYPCAGHCAA